MGLPPERVLNTVTKMKPLVREWLDEECLTSDQAETGTWTAYESFKSTCEELEDNWILPVKIFDLTMRGLGFKKRSIDGTTWVWEGLALGPTTETNPSVSERMQQVPPGRDFHPDTPSPRSRETGALMSSVEQNLPRSGTQEAPEPPEIEFDPLGTCPTELRERYQRRADLAEKHPMKAIELKCIECCGWDRPEAARCELSDCPLWALNRRLFGRGEP